MVVRQELFAPSTNGIRIHIREVRANRRGACDPVLLVHGARVPGAASFDLPVAGGSLAADLVEKGFCVYILDIRGYGQSSRPIEMEQPAQAHPPLVRSVEAVEDIDAATDLIRGRNASALKAPQASPRVSLLGWATAGSGRILRDFAFGQVEPPDSVERALWSGCAACDAGTRLGYGRPGASGTAQPKAWRLSM